jgi:hypothetical protein
MFFVHTTLASVADNLLSVSAPAPVVAVYRAPAVSTVNAIVVDGVNVEYNIVPVALNLTT